LKNIYTRTHGFWIYEMINFLSKLKMMDSFITPIFHNELIMNFLLQSE